MNRPLAIASGALLAAGALSSTAIALSSGDTTARTITVSKAMVTGFSGLQTVSAKMRLSFPTSWTRVSSPATRLSLRTGDGACRYSIVARTGVAVTTAGDAPAFALALAPAKARLVLDQGVRGSSAWRVTRTQDEPRRIVLHAVRVSPLTSVGRRLGLTAGQRAFQVTTVDAKSRVGDECHSGTYRQGVGPSIGDALATARGRAFAS